MDLNVTLIGQTITFIVFIWFTMRYVWPPIHKAMTDRKQTIADGLAAAERGRHELELAQHKVAEYIRDAKIQSASIVEGANQRANRIIEEAKEQAREEGERLLKFAQAEIEKELAKAKEALKGQVATLAMKGAEKILERNIDQAANSDLLEKLITEL